MINQIFEALAWLTLHPFCWWVLDIPYRCGSVFSGNICASWCLTQEPWNRRGYNLRLGIARSFGNVRNTYVTKGIWNVTRLVRALCNSLLFNSLSHLATSLNLLFNTEPSGNISQLTFKLAEPSGNISQLTLQLVGGVHKILFSPKTCGPPWKVALLER